MSLSCHEQNCIMRLHLERYFYKIYLQKIWEPSCRLDTLFSYVTWWWEKYLSKYSLIKRIKHTVDLLQYEKWKNPNVTINRHYRY